MSIAEDTHKVSDKYNVVEIMLVAVLFVSLSHCQSTCLIFQ